MSGDERNAKHASWSADGRWIYFESSAEACGNQLWKRNIDTGEELLLAHCAWGPIEGPDDRVYFLEWDAISSVPVDGGDVRVEVTEPPDCRFYYEGWAIWQRNLIYIDCQDLHIKMLDLDTRETRVLADVYTNEQKSAQLALDVSPDGQWIIYNRLDRAGSDLMLVEPFQ